MQEIFDILKLFSYNDSFYPPIIICCPKFSKSKKRLFTQSRESWISCYIFLDHLLSGDESVSLLLFLITLIGPIKKSLPFLETNTMQEIFDILKLFSYNDPFYQPIIICCPKFSKSVKGYSPRAVSHGYHAIFFWTICCRVMKVFPCYYS